MQVLRYKNKAILSTNGISHSWTFLKYTVGRFVHRNALAFEAINRLSTPHGGNLLVSDQQIA